MADRSFAGGPPYPDRLELDRSHWLRLLRQELRCSLGPGLNHGLKRPTPHSCLVLRNNLPAITFLPTESCRLSGYLENPLQALGRPRVRLVILPLP